MASEKKVKALLVEDVLIQQKVAQLVLENEGYEIDVACNGSEAVTLFNSKKYDIIFMDLGLPDCDGITLSKKIRKMRNGKKIPIVVLTAHSHEEDRKQALAVGLNDFIVKPISTEIAKSIITKLVHDRNL